MSSAGSAVGGRSWKRGEAARRLIFRRIRGPGRSLERVERPEVDFPPFYRIAMEAMRASAHFSYDPNATYIVMTPPRTIGTGRPVYCGYHTQTTSVDGLGNPYRIQYSFIPYLNKD